MTHSGARGWPGGEARIGAPQETAAEQGDGRASPGFARIGASLRRCLSLLQGDLAARLFLSLIADTWRGQCALGTWLRPDACGRSRSVRDPWAWPGSDHLDGPPSRLEHRAYLLHLRATVGAKRERLLLPNPLHEDRERDIDQFRRPSQGADLLGRDGTGQGDAELPLRLYMNYALGNVARLLDTALRAEPNVDDMRIVEWTQSVAHGPTAGRAHPIRSHA